MRRPPDRIMKNSFSTTSLLKRYQKWRSKRKKRVQRFLRPQVALI